MHIKINGTQYPCASYRDAPGVNAVFSGVTGLTLPISGVVALHADDGFELARQNADAYARQKYENGVLTLTSEPEPELPVPTIAEVRAAKLSELSTACEAAIVAGVDVTTSYGTEHFSMSLEDQVNIKAMGDLGQSGSGWLYHPDGGACKMYIAADLVTIHRTASAHKTQQLTYYNFLRQWVERETDTAVIQSITYGDELPDDLATAMTNLLAAVSGGGS
jgi:hypothetical protein